jgi:L-lactate dehydrogenase
MKIGVIGAGAVGSACLLSSILRGIAREIVVVDRERMRAKAVVTDLQYGAALSSVVQIRDGDYSDLTGAALVMITAGMNEQAGGATNRNDPAGRLKLLESNVGIYRKILPEIFRTVPEAVILVVTDPPDPAGRLRTHIRIHASLEHGDLSRQPALPLSRGSTPECRSGICRSRRPG